jgi:transcriptional regulator with XRE-family HTH domain
MKWNTLSSPKVPWRGNDAKRASCYLWNMKKPSHDWYLRQWLATIGLTQQALADATDWQKSKVSRLVSGFTPYDRDIINTIADALHIQPFELLMNPAEAMALRRMRESAVRIAADQRIDYTPEPLRDGTRG